jgi:hypothetical protein
MLVDHVAMIFLAFKRFLRAERAGHQANLLRVLEIIKCPSTNDGPVGVAWRNRRQLARSELHGERRRGASADKVRGDADGAEALALCNKSQTYACGPQDIHHTSGINFLVRML